MAIWHFQVRLVPEGCLAPIETLEGADASTCWRESIAPNWDHITSGVLQKEPSAAKGHPDFDGSTTFLLCKDFRVKTN